MKLNSILVLQNKIDLVKEIQAKEQYQQIIDFVKGDIFNLIIVGFSGIAFLLQEPTPKVPQLFPLVHN